MSQVPQIHYDEPDRAERLSNEFYAGRSGAKVRWAQWGAFSKLIAFALRTRRPSVLLLTLPRSGSSWVGSILGSASDALYLREPFTQGDPAITRTIVFNPAQHPELEVIYRRLADKAFLGWPDFKDVVLYDPEQWSLRERRRRRVVIKEVNPRACQWFLDRYRPRVILLMRHPAAVAWSAQKKDWLGPKPEDWENRGRDQGDCLLQAWDALRNYPARALVTFESLCIEPLEGYRKLYDFAGLRWSEAVAASLSGDSRGSKQKIDAWRNGANPENVKALRRGYNASGAPWYRSDEEW